jgi:cobalt-zinc-cadmium resistance protein CzcA
MESLIAFALRRPVPVLLVAFGVTLAAVVVARDLRLDALPDVTPNQVQVLTTASGLSPAEVERLVTTPIETALGGVPGLVTHRSVSRTGLSAVTAVFDDDVDPWLARQMVGERLRGLNLPEGIDAPELGPHTGGLGEIVQLTVQSDTRDLMELSELVRLRLSPIVRAIPGVVEVNAWGGARRALVVSADPLRLSARGLGLADLTTALRSSTGVASGASLPAGSGEAFLRAVARPQAPAELCHAVVVPPARDRAAITVCDVATVAFDRLPRLGGATKDGEDEVVYVMVQMLRDDNALEVAARIEDVMPRVRQALPDDVVLDVHYDRRALVMATLRTVGTSLLEGGTLVMIVLLILLGSVRAGLIVALAIPLSMVAAAAAMTLSGTPGNLMSLGAIDFGLVVDGSVVLVERLFQIVRQMPDGPDDPPLRRATLATAATDIVRPVFFAVVIIVAVYVPVLALQGVDGKMFRPMALTMVFALMASLAIALTVVPALASLLLKKGSIPTHEPRIVAVLERWHDGALRQTSAHPGRTAVGAGLVLVLGVGGFLALPRSFLPQLDEGDLVIQTTRAADIGDAGAIAAALLHEQIVRQVPEVRSVSSRVGSPAVATDVMGLEQADVFVSLMPMTKGRFATGKTKDELIAELEALVRAHDPHSDPSFTQPIQMRFNELVGGDVNDVALAVTSTDPAFSIEALRAHATRLATQLERTDGAVDVRVMVPPAVPIVDVTPRLFELARAGLTAIDVLDIVQAVRLGVVVGTTWREATPVPIVVRLTPSTSVDAFTLAQLPVPLPNRSTPTTTTTATTAQTAQGSFAIEPASARVVPLSQLADVTVTETPAVIAHGMGRRRVVVGFNVRGRDLGEIRAAVDAIVKQTPPPPGIEVEIGGQFASLDAATARLLIVVPAALLLVFLLLIGAFRAVRPAVVVLVHVPFAAVGGVAALHVASLPLSMPAAIGFIALAGIAVLNGVVLMHEVLQRERHGAPAREAALQGARARLLPVTMTASVAAFGFIPMMLATGVGAEVQRPLATVVVGGLFTSTLLTLCILPTLYPILQRLLGGATTDEPTTSDGEIDPATADEAKH